MPEIPEWWNWDLEFSAHLLKRMLDRGFDEPELREMMEDAAGWRPDVEPGRWVVEVRRDHDAWEVIVEPDRASRMLVVVTAYKVG